MVKLELVDGISVTLEVVGRGLMVERDSASCRLQRSRNRSEATNKKKTSKVLLRMTRICKLK